MNKQTLKLFKALLINSVEERKCPENILKETIKRGFVFSNAVAGRYTDKELLSFIPIVEEELGLTAEKMNKSFHKSWAKVKDSDINDLVIEQLIHYITTYTYERLGIFDSETVYIPEEVLTIPGIDPKKIPLIVINGYTASKLKEKLLNLVDSGIALKEETVKEIADLLVYFEVEPKEIENVKNRELKSVLFDYAGMIPESPIEFLRFAVYKSTNTTLLIKNQYLKNLICDNKDNLSISRMFDKYAELYGLERLAEIFYRYKPIFLAFKTNSKLNKTINRIRKLAIKNHKPLTPDYLGTVTAQIKAGITIDKGILVNQLEKVNVFRKIRLAYALKFRANNPDAIVYKIRNGKAYASPFEFGYTEQLESVLDVVVDSIVKDLNVKGKKIYIPNNINYALPISEKQFTGDVPSGTYISMPRNMIAGIYWENTEKGRIDLDLSLINLEGKFGWDRAYRSEDGDVLFSGDITDASNGAAEHFYVKTQKEDTYLMFVNHYNLYEGDNSEVPLKIIVAQRNSQLKANHMVNPNDLIATVKSSIKEKQKVLGILAVNSKECRFYFSEFYVGKSITSSEKSYVTDTRKYLAHFYKNTIQLRDILEKAGAILVDSKEIVIDIDLSLEGLERDTIINLFKE